jgi:hypothetical protein
MNKSSNKCCLEVKLKLLKDILTLVNLDSDIDKLKGVLITSIVLIELIESGHRE